MGIVPNNLLYFLKSKIIIDKIGLVIQESNLSLNLILKIKQQFKIFIKSIHGNISSSDCSKIIDKYLKDVNIMKSEDVLNKYPLELSRRMNQRITIALSLIPNPKFLILDEPTSSLDVLTQKKVLDKLKEIKKNII